jgi:uncharacterized membrane protein YphA (DoxX/SURF4 family)
MTRVSLVTFRDEATRAADLIVVAHGPFVGSFEIVCGGLVLLGLLTRLAVIPLLVIMAVALATTKWPILVDQGFWAMVHEAGTDWSMSLGSLFLLITGAGPWSLDAWLLSRYVSASGSAR